MIQRDMRIKKLATQHLSPSKSTLIKINKTDSSSIRTYKGWVALWCHPNSKISSNNYQPRMNIKLLYSCSERCLRKKNTDCLPQPRKFWVTTLQTIKTRQPAKVVVSIFLKEALYKNRLANSIHQFYANMIQWNRWTIFHRPLWMREISWAIT